MARYKPPKPDDRLTKKRHRICNLVYGMYAALIFCCILIGGLRQHDPFVSGWALVAMGIISIPVAIFYVYTTKKSWKPQLRSWTSHNVNLETEATIGTIGFVFCSIFPLALGILRLLEIL